MNNLEKIFCENLDCPFEDCDKHLIQLKNTQDKNKHIRTIDFSGICRNYIDYLIDKIETEQGL